MATRRVARSRCSLLVRRLGGGAEHETTVLVDTSPDLRSQTAAAGVKRLIYFQTALGYGLHPTEQPISDPLVRRYADAVLASQALVFVYPTWWGAQPAMLKGWFDRVWANGIAYDVNGDGWPDVVVARSDAPSFVMFNRPPSTSRR